MHTVKPLDTEAVLRAGRECRAIITVEEHSVHGGLGEACAAVLMQAGVSVPFRIVGHSGRRHRHRRAGGYLPALRIRWKAWRSGHLIGLCDHVTYEPEGFIPPHGNYRELLSYQKAQWCTTSLPFCHGFSPDLAAVKMHDGLKNIFLDCS